MPSERGDTKPCTAVGCVGTMQFGRRREMETRVSAPDPASTNVGLDDKGWVCSTEPAHFRKE